MSVNVPINITVTVPFEVATAMQQGKTGKNLEKVPGFKIVSQQTVSAVADALKALPFRLESSTPIQPRETPQIALQLSGADQTIQKVVKEGTVAPQHRQKRGFPPVLAEDEQAAKRLQTAVPGWSSDQAPFVGQQFQTFGPANKSIEAAAQPTSLAWQPLHHLFRMPSGHFDTHSDANSEDEAENEVMEDMEKGDEPSPRTLPTKKSGPVKFFVHGPKGKTVTMDPVDLEVDTIDFLRSRLEKVFNVPAARQRLLFGKMTLWSPAWNHTVRESHTLKELGLVNKPGGYNNIRLFSS